MQKKTILSLTFVGLFLIAIGFLTMGFSNKLFGDEDHPPKEQTNNKAQAAKKERIYSHENLKSNNYERYILVKGKNLKSVVSKLKEYGELPKKGNTYTYQFHKAQLGNWSIIKMPSDFDDYYGFHIITYWFLGYPPEDDNYADLTIGLAIGDSTSYAIYNDYYLANMLGLEDNLFGVFENDEKFILSIPFDEYKESDNNGIKSFNSLMKDYKIDFEQIKNKTLAFESFGIHFNEK